MPRIRKAKIDYISLCPRGKNRMPVILKEDGRVEFDTLIKADMEEGTITAVVYAPDNPDTDGDYADAATIKDMAYGFARDGKGIDIRHDGKAVPKDRAYIAESFIIAKGDERFSNFKDYDGNTVNVADGWAVVIKVDDADILKAYKEGNWNGVSMGGSALKDATKGEETFFAKLAALFRANEPKGDADMALTAKELKEALADYASLVVEEVTKAVKGGKTDGTDDKPGAEDAPVFKGDWSNDNDLREHEKALAIWKARQGRDLSDPEQFQAFREEIAEIRERFAETVGGEDAEAGIEKEDSPEVRELKRRLFKAQKASNQDRSKDRSTGNPGYGDDFTGLSKEDLENLAEGRKAVKSFYGETDKD